jgi:predicted PurR-regulated permease PerM
MTDPRFKQAFLIALVAVISAAFFAMVSMFALTVLLAAIFAGLSYPLYVRLTERLGGRVRLAAVISLSMVMVLILGPLAAVLAAGANEALKLGQDVGPRLQQLVIEPGVFLERLQGLPGYAFLEPYRGEIVTKVGELIGQTSTFLFSAFSATTRATALFVFHFFVLLYTMYFFLTDGPSLLRSVLTVLPLSDLDKARMLDKFVSVTRATLKGTILIGATQGMLNGLAFWAVGIEGPIFWGTVMSVLSIIPGIGGALVWVPAAIVLAVTGELTRAIGLTVFCAIVVGTIDNVMRPRLVGRDTEMHDLMIFFSTIGGLSLFGVTGFILGPLLAALFVTAWEMFAVAFHRELHEAASPIVGPDLRRPE